MKYSEMFQAIRDNIKDVDTDATASVPSAELGRAMLRGIRRLQTTFPETRLDSRGRLNGIESIAYTESTDGDLDLPIPDEFCPALEAYCMSWVYGRDSNDAKDDGLFRHWQMRFDLLTGAAVPTRR